MVPEARVLVQHVAEPVAGVGPAHLLEEVLVPVQVQVREDDPVPLLHVTEPRGGRHVREAVPPRFRYIALGISPS